MNQTIFPEEWSPWDEKLFSRNWFTNSPMERPLLVDLAHLVTYFFITTRNHLPYDKVDDDPTQEEGPKETPLVITIVMIVVVVVVL